MPDTGPHIVVLSSLFPSGRQPGAGLFIRERMFRLGRRLPLTVVSPVPWFPLQGLLRRWRPGFRPGAPHFERQDDHDVWFPRFFSLPGMLKRFDGLSMALGAWSQMRALKAAGRLDIIDAHFGYPDGYAAGLLGRWLGVPVTITLRGTEERHARDAVLRPLLARALKRATLVFAVSDSLRQVALKLGLAPERSRVIGNGVDLDRFQPVDRAAARSTLGLPDDAAVLVSVGGLCERKGFHRVMDCLPALVEGLRQSTPLHYLVVGGPSPEGDWTDRLQKQARELGIEAQVHFTGPLLPTELRRVLSAADVFVLATRNEGWANVFLEAMACGLPVVTTDVGGNREVVATSAVGMIVPFDDAPALAKGLLDALNRTWDRAAIRVYAEAHAWDRRVDELDAEFRAITQRAHSGTAWRAGMAPER
ncbi:MAG: glycosyltransferase [Pseudomonadota bacterium]|nr:glycosyltransferase [Pseudomonadota bacterium]